MASTPKRSDFVTSEAGVAALATLQEMAKNSNFKTVAGYSANSELYPDNVIPFVDKHMKYLQSHPTVNTDHYLANLKLMTKKS